MWLAGQNANITCLKKGELLRGVYIRLYWLFLRTCLMLSTSSWQFLTFDSVQVHKYRSWHLIQYRSINSTGVSCQTVFLE